MRQRDARGFTTTSTYDDARRVTTVTTPPAASAPGGIVTAYTYDAAGKVTQTQQKSMGTVLRTTSATYTLSSQTATTTDANSNTTTFAYDLLDRLVRTTDVMNRVTTYGYDALGRRITVNNAAISANPLAQQSFTLNGQRATLTDANSNVTSFAYDGFDRLATTTYPNSSTTSLAYDADSNVTLRCTRAGKPIAYTYDTLNRLSTKTLPGTAANCAATPDGIVTTFSYDLAGRTTGVSDTSPAIQAISTAGAPLAFTTSTTYDALNRPTGVSYNPAPAATSSPAAFTPVTFSHSYNKVNQRSGQAVSDSA